MVVQRFCRAYMESPPPAVFHYKYQSYKYERNTAGKSARRAAEVMYISKPIVQYLVSDESWKSKLLTVRLQLKLDGGERDNNHCRRTLKEHIATFNHMTKESYPVEGAGLWAAWAEFCPCQWANRRGCGASHPGQQRHRLCRPAVIIFSMPFRRRASLKDSTPESLSNWEEELGGWAVNDCTRPWLQLSFAEAEDPPLSEK